MSRCLVLGMALTVFGTDAAKSNAHVDLSGSIDTGTCSVAGVTRTLPSVGADAFPQAPASLGAAAASDTDVDIVLTGCAGVAGATFQVGSTDDAGADPRVFRNKAVQGAPFTAYGLKEGAGRCVTGTPVAPGDAISKTFTAATYQLALCAQYVKLAGGLVTMGPLSTHFTVTVTYR